MSVRHKATLIDYLAGHINHGILNGHSADFIAKDILKWLEQDGILNKTTNIYGECYKLPKKDTEMCVLCAEWVKEKMNLQEVHRAGSELLASAESETETRHIKQQMARLTNELVTNDRDEDATHNID